MVEGGPGVEMVAATEGDVEEEEMVYWTRLVLGRVEEEKEVDITRFGFLVFSLAIDVDMTRRLDFLALALALALADVEVELDTSKTGFFSCCLDVEEVDVDERLLGLFEAASVLVPNDDDVLGLLAVDEGRCGGDDGFDVVKE